MQFIEDEAEADDQTCEDVYTREPKRARVTKAQCTPSSSRFTSQARDPYGSDQDDVREAQIWEYSRRVDLTAVSKVWKAIRLRRNGQGIAKRGDWKGFLFRLAEIHCCINGGAYQDIVLLPNRIPGSDRRVLQWELNGSGKIYHVCDGVTSRRIVREGLGSAVARNDFISAFVFTRRLVGKDERTGELVLRLCFGRCIASHCGPCDIWEKAVPRPLVGRTVDAIFKDENWTRDVLPLRFGTVPKRSGERGDIANCLFELMCGDKTVEDLALQSPNAMRYLGAASNTLGRKSGGAKVPIISFWLQGVAGSGKTIIASKIAETYFPPNSVYSVQDAGNWAFASSRHLILLWDDINIGDFAKICPKGTAAFGFLKRLLDGRAWVNIKYGGTEVCYILAIFTCNGGVRELVEQYNHPSFISFDADPIIDRLSGGWEFRDGYVPKNECTSVQRSERYPYYDLSPEQQRLLGQVLRRLMSCERYKRLCPEYYDKVVRDFGRLQKKYQDAQPNNLPVRKYGDRASSYSISITAYPKDNDAPQEATLGEESR